MRAVMKRYEGWLFGVSGVGTTPSAPFAQEMCVVPFWQYPLAFLTGGTGTKVGTNNAVAPNVIGFFLHMFSGVRGSMRHRIIITNSQYVDGEQGTTVPTTSFLCESSWGNGYQATSQVNQYVQAASTAIGASSPSFTDVFRYSYNGLAVAGIVNADRIDVEVPYKSPNYYTISSPSVTTIAANGPYAGYLFQKTTSASCVFGFSQLSAIGEDFMPILYLGPTIFDINEQSPFSAWSNQV